jgi:hypothetical protein
MHILLFILFDFIFQLLLIMETLQNGMQKFVNILFLDLSLDLNVSMENNCLCILFVGGTDKQYLLQKYKHIVEQ